MPLSANLFRLESSILTRVKRAKNRNNVSVLAPDSPGAKMSGPEMSSAEMVAPNRPRRIGGAETYLTRLLCIEVVLGISHGR